MEARASGAGHTVPGQRCAVEGVVPRVVTGR